MKIWHSGQVGILVQNRTELTYSSLILTIENVETKNKQPSKILAYPNQDFTLLSNSGVSVHINHKSVGLDPCLYS